MSNQQYIPMGQAGGLPTVSASMEQLMRNSSESEQIAPVFAFLPRSDSMDCVNDPRFMSNSVIAKRLAAFQTISVVAVIMVNLSKATMFNLEKDMDVNSGHIGAIQYAGFVVMTLVFLFNLTTVIVVVQQLFMTYRLLTTGPTGFEVAKSYYLNPNITTLRHCTIKLFFFSLPLFVIGSGAMVVVNFSKHPNSEPLAWPIVGFLAIASMVLCWINNKQQTIFKERYQLAKAHEQPLLSHVEGMSSRGRTGFFTGVDV